MAWTKYGPSEKGCRFYANVCRKTARTRGAPITAAQRRLLNEVGEIFDHIQKEQIENASFLKTSTETVYE